MDNRRGLAIRGKHARIGHATQRNVERLEALDDLARRTLTDGLSDEIACLRVTRRDEVGEKLVRRNVLGEVATSVRSHQHLGAETCLAFDQHGRNLAFRGNRRGEHAGRTAADDRQFDRRVFKRHADIIPRTDPPLSGSADRNPSAADRPRRP